VNDASGDLKAARRSLVVFGVYLLGLAVVLLAAPNVLLAVFGIAPVTDVWIRVVGMLVGFLGYYDARYGAAADRRFLELSVHTRITVLGFFLAFVLFTGAPWQLLLFGSLDFFGAAWTWWSLRTSPRPLAATPTVR
jgi:hypothetical protein